MQFDVTIQALDLNHERRIKIRQAEQLFGLFPALNLPTDDSLDA